MLTLVSFLGKSRIDSKTGYRTARYHFHDGGECETPYFGLALREQLQPDRVVLLGTSSSMWDALVEHLADDDAHAELRMALMDAVRASCVTQDLLDRIAPLVEQALGLSCFLRLIPYGRDADEQSVILGKVAEVVPKGEVALDVTHGFRHLAALGLAAANFLERSANLKLQGLYYGAMDMTQDGVTPVLRLDGLNKVQQWAAALAKFEASGNYGVFERLLVDDGFPEEQAKCLARAANLERLNNVGGAAVKLNQFLSAAEHWLPSGATALFIEKLKRHLRWAKQKDLGEQQRLLALQAHRRGDYLRAAILGLESFITGQCLAAGKDPLEFSHREAIDEGFKESLRNNDRPDWMRDAYWMLKNLRNSMAHGTPPKQDRYRELMENPDRLARELETTLSRMQTSTGIAA